MKINEGSTDRYLRIAAGLVLLGLGVMVGHTLGIILGVLSAILLLTGAVGICPIYSLLGMNTCRR